MPKEIERKFLVRPAWEIPVEATGTDIVQGYLSTSADSTVRVRISGNSAWLTVKSRNHGATRGEWEYPVPVDDAREMLAECGCTGIISKTRYRLPGPDSLTWEVDVFHGPLEGLRVAEVELPAETVEPHLPPFAGREVTGDVRYYNSVLSSATSMPPTD